VADYRLYSIDGAGQIDLADWISAESDDEAVTKARELRPSASRCELWHNTRLVAKLNGQRIDRFGE
jgi:hypothetical protein